MLRIGMAQLNTTVGDLEGNTRRLCEAIDRARDLGVDIVSFPELSIPGYPPEDLLLKADFVRGNLSALGEGAACTPGPRAPVYVIRGVPVGVTICEDIWFPGGPCQAEASAGALLVININGSPYHRGKGGPRG